MSKSQNIIAQAVDPSVLDRLNKRTDAEAARIRRFLAMLDLSRTPGSPLKEVVDRTLEIKSLEGFDIIEIPEIVSTHVLFDLFNMPSGHPARSPSDTYYVDENNVLRTHDTVFWYFYLNSPTIRKKIKNNKPLGVMCYGKVYRKDEIDRSHMNVFHQMGGLYLAPDSQQTVTLDDLKNILSEIGRTIFGEVNFRFYEHTFPYTDPSLEMEAEINGRWVEMVGSGLARKSVLANMGLTGYNGWAFGFGLERLAMASMDLPDIRLFWSQDERVKKQLKLGNKYKEVSKYPPVTRDLSFIVSNDFIPNNYFDLIRDVGGNLIEEVKLSDKFENEEKFGKGKVSYTYHIVYRSIDRTLSDAQVNILHQKLEQETVQKFGAQIR